MRWAAVFVDGIGLPLTHWPANRCRADLQHFRTEQVNGAPSQSKQAPTSALERRTHFKTFASEWLSVNGASALFAHGVTDEADVSGNAATALRICFKHFVDELLLDLLRVFIGHLTGARVRVTAAAIGEHELTDMHFGAAIED